MKMQNYFTYTVLLFSAFVSCNQLNEYQITDTEVAHKWAEMSLYITKHTPANSPTFASRCFGYIGLTMYESIVPGFDRFQSMQGQLNGLNNLPVPERDEAYSWPISLNAAQADIIRKIYIQTSDSNKMRIDSLEQAVFDFYKKKLSRKILNRSVQYGRDIADAIFQWSLSDGGHRGYLKNFDKKLVYPVFPGSWKPPLYAQSFSHFPLHPHWGANRTFVKLNMPSDTPKMIRFDTARSSQYYKQFEAVYNQEKSLTQNHKEIAIYWSDDPDVTFTPGGHSYYLASRITKATHADLITTAMAYARTGMAIADAFINCWKWKYVYFAERPNTFIPEQMDKNWESFWPDPPFPSFPSGHAFQAGAAAAVWIDIFGNTVSVSDSAHYGRSRDELRNTDFIPRQFDSLSQIADEIAVSRFYGGIHTPQDNAVGLKSGKLVGENINKLNWRK